MKMLLKMTLKMYFNPRSLTGATAGPAWHNRYYRFQSTLPYGSDAFVVNFVATATISIHAPLWERLPGRRDILTNSGYFNPRSLMGATSIPDHLVSPRHTSIHAPSRERLAANVFTTSGSDLFQSTLPHGSDRLRNLCKER